MTFAGVLGNRRFRYTYIDGFAISTDADFVITGYVYPDAINKPEGPFGDHLGYYSLTHPFPVMKVHKVFAKKNAIWPFTVVGRPPQEDTSFGELIHEMTGKAVQAEIPGLKEVNAVDAAGVHPLLLAIGSERYTPYAQTKQPAELLTIANHILGTGQLSLAKFLFITSDDSNVLSTKNEVDFFKFILERINLERDVHFYTNTTMDTLDYSGTGLNTGSKVVFAAYGEKIRDLNPIIPDVLKSTTLISNSSMIMPGIIAIQTKGYVNNHETKKEIESINSYLSDKLKGLEGIAMIILCDDALFTSENFKNFLWVTFTRTNPSHDIYGVSDFQVHKHWGCKGPLIIDARIKPHHAPPVQLDPHIVKKTDKLFDQGGSLYGLV
jgi:4-hydroxy-3-polyprenylbenzoate decarboxylase